MRVLLPYLLLYKRHRKILTFSIMLAISTLLASICLLTISGWFLSSSAIAGFAGIYSFNYMLPAAGIRGISLMRTAGRYFERLVSHDTTFRVLQYLRVFTFSRLMPISSTLLTSFRQGELLNLIVADVDTLDHLYLRVVSPLLSLIIVITILTLELCSIDTILSVTLGGIMLTVLFLFPSIFYFCNKSIYENLSRLRCEYRQQLTIWLQCQAELAIFGANDRYRIQIDSTECNWQSAQRKKSELSALSQAMITLIGGATVTVMLWIASINISNNQKQDALIAVFIFCTIAAFEALAPIANIFQYVGQVIASAIRITRLTEQPRIVQFDGKHTQVPLTVALCLRKVTFIYNGQTQPALKDITLDIPAGKHFAILGRTGCGKSTLLRILTRAWDPNQGFITINNIPLINFSEYALRRSMSVVTQRVHLFSATLRDNLLLASPDADDSDLKIALDQVGLDNLLEGKGLDSWLGEGGRVLSGGELRRLAIARVLLHDAQLMLLDEPTEGLDAFTESQIMNLFKQIMKNKTVLMVTHSLYGLKNFDQIIILDNGQIIEQGNHEELLARQGIYYRQLKHNIL